MQKWEYIVFFFFAVLIFVLINYTSFDGFVVKKLNNQEFVEVERVIDGDTVVVNGTSVRMLGLNSPERGEKYYSEAKEYTSSLVMNKTIMIERRGTDRYDRELAYLFYNDEDLNSKVVEKGYANYYFPDGPDNYYSVFVEAWEKCIERNENLCKKSQLKCAECIVLHKFGPDEDLILFNSCDFNCNIASWSIKDEGRKTYVFNNFILKSNYQVEITAEDFNQTYVWTNTGDTMFLRDGKGDLVLWESY
jgi:micrococcal nuclease